MMNADAFAGDCRRLPVYLVIDTSGSMSNPIRSVNEGLGIFREVIQGDPNCRECVHICIICFDSTARISTPLTDATKFQPPTLTVSGLTAYSCAIDLLREEIARNQRPRSEDYAGDYKPLVFFFTDGAPNAGDPWDAALARLNERKGLRPHVVAIGAGDGADESVLRRIAPEQTYMMRDLNDPKKVHDLFKWLANSTVAVSQRAGADPAVGMVLGDGPPQLFT